MSQATADVSSMCVLIPLLAINVPHATVCVSGDSGHVLYVCPLILLLAINGSHTTVYVSQATADIFSTLCLRERPRGSKRWANGKQNKKPRQLLRKEHPQQANPGGAKFFDQKNFTPPKKRGAMYAFQLQEKLKNKWIKTRWPWWLLPLIYWFLMVVAPFERFQTLECG